MNHSAATTKPDLDNFKKKFIQSFQQKLQQRYAQNPFSLDEEKIPSLIEDMLQLLPQPHPYNELIGPFYSGKGVQRILGITRQAIAKRAKKNDIICCPLGNGKCVYPVWQFTDQNSIESNIIRTYKELRKNSDEWTAALWLSSPWSINDSTLIRDKLLNNNDQEIAEISVYVQETSAKWGK